MSSREVFLSCQIRKKLRDLSPHPSTCRIFKVPGPLRRVNERAYEPEIISVGPYHRGKDNLKMMEENKKRYLKKLLKRTVENSLAMHATAIRDEEERARQCLEMYVTAIRNEAERARQCYDQPVSLDEDEFVEMLLLDGCFIVELIRKFNNPRIEENDDPVIDVPWILYTIAVDMLLLENQLPFFVLRRLFTLTTVMLNEDFFPMTLKFFRHMFPSLGCNPNNTSSGVEYKHLLGIVYHHWQRLPSPATSIMSTETMENNWKFIRCAKELKEAGIEFKKQEGPGMLFDGIHFEKGKMLIPSLRIEDGTESFFRNLVAYEQCSQLKPSYVTDYTTLMDCLINTKEDVQILQHSGIIENWLGDDEMVCTFFNKLGTNVIHYRDFYYAGVFNRVKKHCKRPHNRWLAMLRHDYFNSPWAGISFFAALALLLLTSVQTVFTVKS